MGAQHRITANLGLPEYRLPESVEASRPYQVREWTYHNRLTGEEAIQVVERYDGPCWRKDCNKRFPHKHPWMKREEKWRSWPTDGFLLLEHPAATPKPPENAECFSPVNGKPCNSCNRLQSRRNQGAPAKRRRHGELGNHRRGRVHRRGRRGLRLESLFLPGRSQWVRASGLLPHHGHGRADRAGPRPA